jgi:hypothetical protein
MPHLKFEFIVSYKELSEVMDCVESGSVTSVDSASDVQDVSGESTSGESTSGESTSTEVAAEVEDCLGSFNGNCSVSADLSTRNSALHTSFSLHL